MPRVARRKSKSGIYHIIMRESTVKFCLKRMKIALSLFKHCKDIGIFVNIDYTLIV